ncbi:MAG TPA: acetylglutamate kinase [Candidatus Krumholzibacteria bacterium]|nr:acetylglutamate kinase [Candidatus Krumholzibacteria bacterium]
MHLDEVHSKPVPAGSQGATMGGMPTAGLELSSLTAAPARGVTVVFKYGGSVQEDATLARTWAHDLATLVRLGLRPIVVHGGGPELTRVMQRLGVEPRFVDGHRITDAETATLAEMVFARINKQIVALLARVGVRAMGISGSDGGLLQVRTHRPEGRDLGFVGAVEAVDPAPLLHLQQGGFVPVISPTATDACGQLHNINADFVAAAVAAAMHASELVFLSDVPGYLEDGHPVAILAASRAQALLRAGAVQGGMQPKLEAALQALAAGVPRVRLLDGRTPHIVLTALWSGASPGTVIVPAEATGAPGNTPPAPAWAGTLAARGAAVLVDSYTREPLELAGGAGCLVVDSAGKSYLDFGAGIGVSALGHGHPALVAALRGGASGLLHTSNLYWTEPMVGLAERLVDAAGMERAFFCNSGTEAVEAALKLGRKTRPGRKKIVVFQGGFHGRTFGSLSATMQENYQAPFRPLLEGFVAVPFGDFEAASAAIDTDTALVLVEPIQGEGGVRPAPAGFLAHLRASCDRCGALLVFDEVQTGLGRTGTFLAAQGDGVVPDAVTLAKALAGGLPMGALLARGEAARALGRGEHGSTFGGGPFVARAAHAVLDTVLAPGFLAGVRARGAELGARLALLATAWPEVVKEARGRGLMWGLELRQPRAPELVGALRELGFLGLQAGKNVLRLLPPLVVSAAEIDAAGAFLERGLVRLGGGDGAS